MWTESKIAIISPKSVSVSGNKRYVTPDLSLTETGNVFV